MEQLFAEARQNFTCFVEQRRDLIQLVNCSDNDVPVVLKLIRDVEQASPSDVFLMFADAFHHPGAFVDVVMERLREEHALAADWLKEQEKDPIPGPPESVFDSGRDPAERLLEGIEYSRSLMPCCGGHRLVWVLFPTQIVDMRGWYQLIQAFSPRDGVKPWMRHLRLIFRDHPKAKRHRNGLVEAPRVVLHPVDFSAEALDQASQEQMEDENQPIEKRMEALLLLAQRDYAYNRSKAALHKYNTLLGHYQSTENHGMQALVLNGMGDVHHRINDLARAQHYYECAVPEVTQSSEHVVFYTIVKNLGDVTYKRKNYPMAEECYGHAETLATHLLDAEGKAQMLEKKGLAQEKQKKHEAAVQSWENAVTLCRGCEMDGLLKVNLKHLERGYKQTRQKGKAAAIGDELKQLKQRPAEEG